MTIDNVIIKKNPKIEFQLHDNGFQLIDEEMEQNCGFYLYNELQSTELDKAWFPKLSKWLRIITSIFNSVPYFPDAGSYKKANIIIHLKKVKLGIWLTDSYMVAQAKMIKNVLDKKTNYKGDI